MTFFGVELEWDDCVAHFMDATEKNFVFTEFFEGKLKRVERSEGKVWCLFHGSVPLPAPYGWMGLIAFFLVFVFAGLSWWLLLPLAVLAPLVVKSRWVWLFMFWKSLRKYGYKGSIRVLSYDEIFLEGMAK